MEVKAGDILARIDDRDFSTSVDRAKADVDSSTARLTDAEKNHGRLSSLFSKGAASKAQFDAGTSALNELKGRFSAAKAQLDLAKINLEYATIRAPFDGFVAKRSAEVGQFVGVGSPLFGFVDSAERWVTANLKETEISGVESGSRVDVRVDAIPGRTYPGTVKQLSASTGAAFTLIPPDNATGNFTKVVQRVPVKISLDEVSAEDARLLKAGLSADVRIHRRKWW
ncbi:HlyD family secretion protein [bacterium]|nr:HlyD family secretion protein [bacterium]